jgi:predicted NUDIX family phosphoesterase
MPDEQILVVKRSVFDKLGAFQGVNFQVNHYLEKLLCKEELEFVPRAAAEKNPQLKQLIPYVIMAYEDSYLCYQRGKRAGEQRLVEKISIGIGGHINPVDDTPLFCDDFSDIYHNAVAREVAEEIDIQCKYNERIVGLLNDDSNEVGRVHLGVIHLWQLEAPLVTKREQMICKLDFMKIPQLNQIRNKMETWSQLCLDNLTELVKSPGVQFS